MSEYAPFQREPAARVPTGTVVPLAQPGSLAAIIARIADAVDEETAAIRTDVRFDIKAANARKSRCLYDLNRAVKAAGAAALAEHRPAILALREKLARNEAALLAHLSAVGEVAALLKDAIRRSETDGTYSEGEFGYAR